MRKKAKFGIGDKVRIVGYGSVMAMGNWDKGKISHPILKEEGNIIYVDWMPDLIGKVGIICEKTGRSPNAQYALKGIPQKIAWYDEEQLKMIAQNPNRR